MNMNKKSIAVAVLASSIGAPALAQQPTGSEGNNLALEEVIVTATRREQSIYDVPVAVSAFTEETMIRQGVTGVYKSSPAG